MATRTAKRNKNNRKKSRRLNKNRRNRIRLNTLYAVNCTSSMRNGVKGGDNSNTIKVVSYNILDVDLESNFVPRTMDSKNKTALENIIIKIDKNKILGLNLNINFNKDELNLYELAGKLYAGGFHSGGLIKNNELNKPLNKVETRQLWGSNEELEFVLPLTNKTNVNLRKMLTVDFINSITEIQIQNTKEEQQKYDTIFTSIQSINDTTRNWSKTRGQKIFDKIVSTDADIICLQEYGNCKDKIIGEIDVKPINETVSQFEKNTDKRKFLDESENNNAKNRLNTLPNLMIKRGYEYYFFGYNPDTTNGDDGVAIFFKTDKFSYKDKISIGMDMDVEAEFSKETSPYKSLRRAGLLVLTHKNPSKNIIICTAHLQSDSNERVDKNTNIKNKVKIIELGAILNQLDETYNEYGNDTAIIFCGDFNLNKETTLQDISKINKPGVKINESGVNINDQTQLNRVKPTPELEFTTYSSRTEYIDYFYSNIKGSIDTTGVYKEKIEMPNEKEPSDHIMLAATFDLNPSSRP